MPPRHEFAIPTNAPFPHTHRLPHSSNVTRSLSKLSRPSLISLALEWLSPEHIAFCRPVLSKDAADDADAEVYSLVDTLDELREVYQELGARKGGKKEVVDRIIEGDWRHGLTLYQYAMAETKHLTDHPSSLRWNALQITSSRDADSGKESNDEDLPRVHGPTLLSKLEREIAPLTKAHYYLTRLKHINAILLRLLLHESPYSTQKSLQALHGQRHGSLEEPKSLYLLFPDGTPYVYVSMTSGSAQDASSESRSLKAVILDAVALALSRRGARYTLKPTNFSAKSLDAMLALRGPGRTNSSQGGWSIYVDNSCGAGSLDYRNEETRKALDSSSKTMNIKMLSESNKSKRPLELEDATQPEKNISSAAKRRKVIAKNRFGTSGLESDSAPIERFDVRITDVFPALPSNTNTSLVMTAEPNLASQKAPSGKKRGRPTRCPSIDESSDEHETAVPKKDWTPSVRLTFHGSHVFAGIRALVEQGKINGEKMPGWMTGEASINSGIVKNGRIAKQGESGGLKEKSTEPL